MTWREFWTQYADTVGVALVFALFGSGFALWASSNKKPITRGQALVVVAAGLLVASIATALVHGYLGWNIFLAPCVGFLCGLLALPIIWTVIRGGRRVEMRADDLADHGLERLGVPKNKGAE